MHTHPHMVLLIWKDDNHSIFYNNIFIPFHQCLLNWSTFTLKKTQILHLHIALIRLQNVFLFISLLNWIKAPLHSRKNVHLHNVLFRLPEDHLNIVSLWLQYCYSRSVVCWIALCQTKNTCVFVNILEIKFIFTWLIKDKDLTLIVLVQKITISFTVDTKN